MFNKIYNEDCVLGMKKLPDDSIDLIVTSPPYNLNIQYAEYGDDMTLESYYGWCKEWIKESWRVIKPGGRFCLQIGCFESSQNEPTYSNHRLPIERKAEA